MKAVPPPRPSAIFFIMWVMALTFQSPSPP
jgi:hypothetical protein